MDYASGKISARCLVLLLRWPARFDIILNVYQCTDIRKKFANILCSIAVFPFHIIRLRDRIKNLTT